MDLFVLIIIIVFVFIIKYLIDTINSLNGEIREIKEKCIIGSKASGAGEGASGGSSGITFTKNTEQPSDNVNKELIKTLVYFKDYFDNNK
jgi:mevalonate kinase